MQLFDVTLGDWGELKFVSREPIPVEQNDWKVASFYLIKDNQILYRFPYKEFFGIPERFSLFAATGFNAVLGIYLFQGFPVKIQQRETVG